MVLALCVAHAYAREPKAARDAGSSFSALRDWTNYDMEDSADAIQSLVAGYLARNYRNPLVEAEVKGIEFDFLKCLDLYHGPELDAQIRRFVLTPERTYRDDNSPSDESTQRPSPAVKERPIRGGGASGHLRELAVLRGPIGAS